jgi:hypothetical protein
MGGLWNIQRIANILYRRAHTEKYLGGMTYNRTRQNKRYKRATPKPEEEWILCINAHEAIITQEMVDAVRARYRKKKKRCPPKDV